MKFVYTDLIALTIPVGARRSSLLGDNYAIVTRFLPPSVGLVRMSCSGTMNDCRQYATAVWFVTLCNTRTS